MDYSRFSASHYSESFAKVESEKWTHLGESELLVLVHTTSSGTFTTVLSQRFPPQIAATLLQGERLTWVSHGFKGCRWPRFSSSRRWVSIPRGLGLRKSSQAGRAKEATPGRASVTLVREGGDLGLFNINPCDRNSLRPSGSFFWNLGCGQAGF